MIDQEEVHGSFRLHAKDHLDGYDFSSLESQGIEKCQIVWIHPWGSIWSQWPHRNLSIRICSRIYFHWYLKVQKSILGSKVMHCRWSWTWSHNQDGIWKVQHIGVWKINTSTYQHIGNCRSSYQCISDRRPSYQHINNRSSTYQHIGRSEPRRSVYQCIGMSEFGISMISQYWRSDTSEHTILKVGGYLNLGHQCIRTSTYQSLQY